jgi:hypothetical protein
VAIERIDGSLTTDEQVGTTDEQVGRADERVGTIDEQVGTIDEQVGTIDEQVGTTDERVGTIDEQVGTTDEQVGRTDEQVGSTERPEAIVGGEAGTWKDGRKGPHRAQPIPGRGCFMPKPDQNIKAGQHYVHLTDG